MQGESQPISERLFLALWPPLSVRDALQKHADQWQWPRGARRIPNEKLHMTLHFLGDVPVQRQGELAQRLSFAFEPFDLQLETTGIWGSGIAVLCARECPPELRGLHVQLAKALMSMELPVEQRPFRPHVTLARNAKGAIRAKDSAAIAWRADEGYTLVRSLPEGRGYEIVKRFT